MRSLQTESKIKLTAAGFSGVLLAAKPLIAVLTTRRRDLSDYGAVDASAMVNIVYTFIIMAQCLMELVREREIPYMKILFATNLRWFVWFTIWGGVTTLWSVNPALSGFRTLECAAYFLLIVIVAARLVFQHGIPVMLGWFMRWYLVADIGLRAVSMAYRGMGMIDIVTYVSQMTAPVFFYLVLFHEPSHWIRVLIVALTFLSRATTAYIGVAMGTLGLWFGSKKKKTLALFLLLAVFMGMLWVGPEAVLKETVFRERSGIGLEYSSGRDKLWEFAWENGNRRPWSGYGFFAAEPHLLYDRGLGAITCHSSFLSALLGTGYFGLMLLSVYIFSYIPLLLGSTIPKTYRSALMGSYAVALLQCLGNPGIGSRVYGSWMSVTILFAMISVIGFYNRHKIVITHKEQ